MAEGKTVVAAADAAAMSERTTHKWKAGALPSEARARRERERRTRGDPFANVWESDVLPLLAADQDGVLETTTRPKLLEESHAAAAIGHALVERGRSVLFTHTFRLVQGLLAANRDPALPSALQKVDGLELLILDDISHVQQSAEEVEVLFMLMASATSRELPAPSAADPPRPRALPGRRDPTITSARRVPVGIPTHLRGGRRPAVNGRSS